MRALCSTSSPEEAETPQAEHQERGFSNITLETTGAETSTESRPSVTSSHEMSPPSYSSGMRRLNCSSNNTKDSSPVFSVGPPPSYEDSIG